MKSNLLTILALALALTACTQQQLNEAEQVALPIAETAAIAAASYYGVPPNTTTAITGAVNSLWGAYAQAQAGQPVSQGAVNATIGNAIQQAIPAGTSPSKTVLALQAAATMLQQVQPTAATPAPSGVPVSLWNSSPALRGNVRSLGDQLRERLDRDARQMRQGERQFYWGK